jgi:hypothetical protein
MYLSGCLSSPNLYFLFRYLSSLLSCFPVLLPFILEQPAYLSCLMLVWALLACLSAACLTLKLAFLSLACLSSLLPVLSKHACLSHYLSGNITYCRHVDCLEPKLAFLFSSLSCPYLVVPLFTKFFSVLPSSSSLVFFSVYLYSSSSPLPLLQLLQYVCSNRTIKCQIKLDFTDLLRSFCYFCCCSKRIPCSTYLHVDL